MNRQPSKHFKAHLASTTGLPRRCWAEVDLGALRDNLAWIRHRVGPRVQVLAVVKADAYGHGLECIAGHLMRCGADGFGVANLAEARAIRRVGSGWPVLLLGACLPEEVEEVVRDGVTATISTGAEVRAFSKEGVRHRRKASLHLKVDTGMGRLGASLRDGVRVAAMLRRSPGVSWEGIYTHLSSVEDDSGFTRTQLDRFRRFLGTVRAQGGTPACVHAGNSGGLLHEPEAWFDLVRPGLLVYGIVPPGRRSVSSVIRAQFRPALSLHARVTLVRAVARGATVSYGHGFRAGRPMRLAVISAGYGDGYPRACGGRAQILIRGRRCPVIGRVTMDQTVVDVTAEPGVRTGDEAVLLGPQGDEEVSATQLADWSDTIPWEVLTGISYRVPRVYRGVRAS